MNIIFKLLKQLLDILGITWVIKFASVVIFGGGFILYILARYSMQEVQMVLLIFGLFAIVTIGVLATHGRKGDIQDVGYNFEFGRSRAQHNFKEREKNVQRGFIWKGRN